MMFGAQDTDEPGDRGSRSFIGIGVQLEKSFGLFDCWVGVGGAGYLEAPDDKLSAITGRLNGYFGARYNDLYKIWKFSFSPFMVLGLNNWNRNIYPQPEDPLYIGRFEEMRFVSVRGGVKISLDRFFLEIGPTLPLWSDTDKGHNLSGKLGLTAFLGVSTNIVDVGLFYDSISFSGDMSSSNRQPDFCFSELGLKAFFKF